MKNLTKTTVYVPVNTDEPSLIVQQYQKEIIEALVEEQQAFVFNEEQLNGLLSSVIRETLKVAAEKFHETFHTVCEDGSTKGVFKTQKEALDFANTLNNKSDLYHDWVKVTQLNGGLDKKSILNQFDNLFEKFKV